MTQMQCLTLYFLVATANNALVTVDAVPSTDVELPCSKSPIVINNTKKITWTIEGVIMIKYTRNRTGFTETAGEDSIGVGPMADATTLLAGRVAGHVYSQ